MFGSMLKQLGNALLAAVYTAVPIIGWIFLARSFKQLKTGEIALIQGTSGDVEIIDEPGIYFRPFPGDSFGDSFSKTTPFIDFGPIKRVFVAANQAAVKMNEKGEYQPLNPGYNFIQANETYQNEWLVDCTSSGYHLGNIHYITIAAGEVGYAIDNNTGKLQLLETGKHELAANLKFGGRSPLDKDVIDFPSLKIVRIKQGFLGVKTNAKGLYEVLEPGIHKIDTGNNETFDPKTGIQDVSQANFTLGNLHYIRICNGELGESYKNGVFYLLEPGLHKLEPNHIFKKLVKIDSDVVDLGALKIVTVKEGQVALVNTKDGVITHKPGKYNIKQEEGNFFNTILTTSLQRVLLDPVKVICSDKIEMTAKAMVLYEITDPLKTVGLGIGSILKILQDYSEGVLRSILSRFSSSDLSLPLEQDDATKKDKRAEILQEMHDNFVESLESKASSWGLKVTDLQILEILPTDVNYLNTLQGIGAKNAQFAADKIAAQNAADILKINADAGKSKNIAAQNEREAETTIAGTKAAVAKIAADAEANRLVVLAKAEADSTKLTTEANAERMTALNKAMKGASPAMQRIMEIEANGKITTTVMERVKNPVFIQPTLGDTSTVTRTSEGATFFSTKGANQAPIGQERLGMAELLALGEMQQAKRV